MSKVYPSAEVRYCDGLKACFLAEIFAVQSCTGESNDKCLIGLVEAKIRQIGKGGSIPSSDIEDLLQEITLKTHREKDRIQGNPRGWIWRLGLTTAWGYLRRARSSA